MTIVCENSVLQYKKILEATVKEVVPDQLKTNSGGIPNLLADGNISILLAFTGNVIGKFILSGEIAAFERISELIYGMRLEGSMLESFASELANMMGGHCATHMAQLNMPVDITAPTILKDSNSLPIFQSSTGIHAQLQQGGSFSFHLIPE